MVEHSTVARPRVLVVDESRTVREGLRKRMGDRFDVREESDGEAGWQALLVDPSIQIVIAAVSMPKLDGYGLLNRVRGSNISRIHSVRVVMMSGDETGTLGTVARSLGAADVIFKGIGDAELTTRLEALVNPSRVPKVLTETNVFVGRQARSEAKHEPPAKPQPKVAASPSPSARKESDMSRLDSLNRVLKNLQSESPGVEASALISEDGLMIASALPQDLDETRVGGMSATLLNLGTRAATELRRGSVREVIVRGELGCAVMISAGRGAVLLVLATESTPLGLIFFDMREALKSIKEIL